MFEEITLSHFDIIGIFTLQDISGIEDYVTPVSDKNYLSRSANYYGAKSYTELSNTREYLRTLLTNEASKRNFVIIDCCAFDNNLIFYDKNIFVNILPAPIPVILQG